MSGFRGSPFSPLTQGTATLRVKHADEGLSYLLHIPGVLSFSACDASRRSTVPLTNRSKEESVDTRIRAKDESARRSQVHETRDFGGEEERFLFLR